MTAAGAATVNPYVEVGPTFQTAGYGWGTYLWGNSTWGTERTVSNVILDAGNWSLDNFGEVLVATIFNGKTFTWDAGAGTPRGNRASQSTTNFNTTNIQQLQEFLLYQIEIDTYFTWVRKQL